MQIKPPLPKRSKIEPQGVNGKTTTACGFFIYQESSMMVLVK